MQASWSRSQKRKGISLSLPKSSQSPAYSGQLVQSVVSHKMPNVSAFNPLQASAQQQPVATISIQNPSNVYYYVASKPNVSFSYSQVSSVSQKNPSISSFPHVDLGESAKLDLRISQLEREIGNKKEIISKIKVQNPTTASPRKYMEVSQKVSQSENRQNHHWNETVSVPIAITESAYKIHRENIPPIPNNISNFEVSAVREHEFSKISEIEVSKQPVQRKSVQKWHQIQAKQQPTASIVYNVRQQKPVQQTKAFQWQKPVENPIQKTVQKSPKKQKQKSRNEQKIEHIKENINSDKHQVDVHKLRLMQSKLLDIIRVCENGL